MRYLVEWCDENGITDLNDLTGRRLHEFCIWRRNEGDLAPPTERTQMSTIRVFLRWPGTIDGLDPDLHHKVRVPNYAKGEHNRDDIIDSETAEQMLAYLGTYEYASRDHGVLAILREIEHRLCLVKHHHQHFKATFGPTRVAAIEPVLEPYHTLNPGTLGLARCTTQ